MPNDCAMEQTRGEATLDNHLWQSGLGARCQQIDAPIENRDHNNIRFNISVGERVADRHSMITFNFRKGNFSKM